MVALRHGTAKISWQLMLSAIKLAKLEFETDPIDLNLNSLATVVLSCNSIEAFSSEVVSILAAIEEGEHGDYVEKISNLNGRMDLFNRYNAILGILKKSSGGIRNKMNVLKDLRNHLVHYRYCDMPLIDEKGCLIHDHKPPAVFSELEKYNVKNRPLIAMDGAGDGIEWPLRISTNAMAIWSIEVALDAVFHIIDSMPSGAAKDAILRTYRQQEVADHVFTRGKHELTIWKAQL